MKTKKYIIILACCILAAAFILGITGVVNLSTGIQVKNSDRLIGFLITRDSLDQADDYHYPATRVEKQGTIEVDGEEEPYLDVNYVFEGIDGIPFMLADTTGEDGVNSSTTISDGAVSDVRYAQRQIRVPFVQTGGEGKEIPGSLRRAARVLRTGRKHRGDAAAGGEISVEHHLPAPVVPHAFPVLQPALDQGNRGSCPRVPEQEGRGGPRYRGRR